ncbi:MAG: cyclase family protein [Nitrospirae bacterium]|nr:MAG: cyclase family protein [Nitrospirota bacterium]
MRKNGVGFRGFVIVFLLGTLLACSSFPRTIVDLTYPFDEHTIYWPTNQHFHRRETSRGFTAQGYWYASGAFSASEHGGTHLDAPIHFAASGMSVDEIPVQTLIGPAVVIDVSAQCETNPDYELSIADVTAWEAQHGRIESGTLVLLRTGWSAYWPDPVRYLGSQTPEDPATLHFPGFSAEAAQFLVTHRHIRGVGIDTASIDPGRSSDFPVHRIISQANLHALENVAGLDQLPPRGATIFALPMKIRGGSGGPVRIVALLP